MNEDKLIKTEIERCSQKLGILKNEEQRLQNRLRIVRDEIEKLELHIVDLIKRATQGRKQKC